MNQLPANPQPPAPKPPSNGSWADIIPFLGVLGFAYIFMTMGHPGRMPWEAPAIANDGGYKVVPMCTNSDTPTAYDWYPCENGGDAE